MRHRQPEQARRVERDRPHREDEVVHEEPEREGREREVDVAESQGGQRDDQTDATGEETRAQHRHERGDTVLGAELGRGHGADADEGRLSERDHAAVAGDRDERQENDRKAASERERGEPVAAEHEGRRGHRCDPHAGKHPAAHQWVPAGDVTRAGRRRRRLDARQDAAAALEQQRSNKHEERKRRAQTLGQDPARPRVLGADRLGQPDPDRAPEGQRQVPQAAHRRGGEPRDHEQREVVGFQSRNRSEEHAGETGKRAPERP